MSTQESTSEIGAASRMPVCGEADLRELVSKALHACRKHISREQVAQELTARTGHKITKGMLDDWATPSKKGLRVPAFLIKPLCEVTGNNDPAMAVLPYRVVFLVTLGEWVYQSRRTLERVHQDLIKLTETGDRKRSKTKPTRKA